MSLVTLTVTVCSYSEYLLLLLTRKFLFDYVLYLSSLVFEEIVYIPAFFHF